METPVVNRADVVKNMYRGYALSQLRILKQEMELGGLTTSARTVRLENGVVIVCKKTYKQETIDIFIPEKLIEYTEKEVKFDFLVHPKNAVVRRISTSIGDDEYIELPTVASEGFAVKGNWYVLSNSGNVYSFSDTEKTAFSLKVGSCSVGHPKEQLYGNLYWTDGTYTVSWRGNPSVQFPVPGKANVADVSKYVNKRYTVFDRYIYSKGKVLVEFEEGCLVAGACVKVCDGTVYLVAFINRLINGSYWFQVLKLSISKTDWEEVYSENTQKVLTTPVFIDKTGSKFAYDGVSYLLNSGLTQVTKATLQLPTNSVGTCSITGTGGYNSSYEYADNGVAWPSLNKLGNFVFSSYTVNAKFSLVGNSSNYVNPLTKQVPVYRGNPATSVGISIDKYTTPPCLASNVKYKMVLVASPNGDYCSVSWTGVDCAIGLIAVKLLDSCEKAVSVSCTLHPQEVTGTFERELPQGGITIVGQNAAAVGVQYSATGAVGDVYWTISKGTIDGKTGIITNLDGACGTAVVMVIDDCQRTATKIVTLPVGTWVETVPRCCITYDDVPDDVKPHLTCDTYNCYSYGKIVGNTKYWYDIWPGWMCQVTDCSNFCPNCPGHVVFTGYSVTTYEWRCP